MFFLFRIIVIILICLWGYSFFSARGNLEQIKVSMPKPSEVGNWVKIHTPRTGNEIVPSPKVASSASPTTNPSGAMPKCDELRKSGIAVSRIYVDNVADSAVGPCTK